MEIFKDLHVSVAEACEASFDNAYKSLEIQLAAHEARVHEAERSASIANKARQAAECRLEELQHEITALREELHHYEIENKDVELPGDLVNLESEFSPKHIWRPDLHDVDQLRELLEDKYTTLYNDLQIFVRSWSSLKSKVLQHKKKLRHWDRQLERDQFTLLLHGAPVTFQRVPATDPKNWSNSPTQMARARSVPESDVTRHVNHDPGSTRATQNTGCSPDTAPNIKLEENSQRAHSIDQPVASIAKSSQTRCIVSPSESSDVLCPLPEIQNRKRKRVGPSSQDQAAEGAPERPLLIKAETMSSSPSHQSIASAGPNFPSTQDLDDIGGTVATPTKRNHHREVHWEDENPDAVDQDGTTSKTRAGVLQHMDGNIRTPRSWGQGTDTKKQRVMEHRAALAMGEDGEYRHGGNVTRENRSKSIPTTPVSMPRTNAGAKASRSRLQGLLEGSLPTKSPIAPARNGAGHRQGHSPKSSRNCRSSESASCQSRSEQSEETATQTHLDVQPEEEPFRARPLHRLNLGHFKINPARNQGLDFAYDAVVRNKDDRKCLSGCTRPGCCGDHFRAMVRLGQTSNPTDEQREEDQRILEEYVGEDRHLLDGLSDQDRQELVIEARARALANKHGKHRHTHQRARSPPGFWRTDMPSTQELEADRQDAQAREREKVSERYREAMRPGGLWTWADE
ncbi:DNA repair protein Sae2/CtIP [Penicillium macrosclerotiorum]|uniref:DNA repair protein Sae2/CtIP n=1 Tax=Penicillium macrosclerotiorum TaxID=303699 RepID=UPI002546AE74|nr:DNA repair protein Sae2/CtIP [Penicillium macrosclerotiorum]KAJ5693315.1 DNA repair protein Sae2/CtIP [Penicillium macrosclerotiorum]